MHRRTRRTAGRAASDAIASHLAGAAPASVVGDGAGDGEQPEPVIQAPQGVGQRQRLETHRGQLDRPRDAVEPLTQATGAVGEQVLVGGIDTGHSQ